MRMSPKIHIAFCLEDKTGDYCRHMAVTMISIMQNTQHKIIFHVIHDDSLSLKNRKLLDEMVSAYSSCINYYEVEDYTVFSKIKAAQTLSRGALYKFLIPSKIPDAVERVLYLDTDIVVNMDIADVYYSDLKGMMIGAVKDPGVKKNPSIYHREIPVNLEKYFNSGVILFDLSKTRKEIDLLQGAMSVLNKYPNEPFVDQPPFNLLLQNDCMFLDEKFNRFTDEMCKKTQKAIFHYAGAYKPWKMRVYDIDKIYWDYFVQTSWGNSLEKLIYYYSMVVAPLDHALLTYPTGSRKKFFKNVIIRSKREIKWILNKFFRHV